MQSSKIDRIKYLVEQLNAASESYYAKDREIMSNYEYDKLYDELLELEKETIEIAVGDFSELRWKVLKTDGSLSRSVENEDMVWVSDIDLDEGIYYSAEKAGTGRIVITAEE